MYDNASMIFPIIHPLPETLNDSGLKMKNLLNFIYIPLDIFRKSIHNESNKVITEQDAWLYFLSSDNPQDILHLTEQYPMFRELYQDIVKFRYQPREMMTMYSEALANMDKNTELYMIDRMKKQIKKMETALVNKEAALAESKAENERLRSLLAERNGSGNETN